MPLLFYYFEMKNKLIPIFSSIFIVSFLCPHLEVMGMEWMATNYGDESWSVGTAELGYGYEGVATVLWSGHTAYYFRQDFWLTDTGHYTELLLRIKYDDGFVAYINGDEVTRANMPPGIVSYDTLALSPHEGGDFEDTDISWFLTDCHNGWNELTMALAIEVHQCEGGFDDLSFDAALRAKRKSDGLWVEIIEDGSVWSYYTEASSPPSEKSDPITHIQRPLLNIPVIQIPGGDFEIECLATNGISWWTAGISTPCLDFDLPIWNVTTTHTWGDTSRYLLDVSIPEGIPFELYDLTVEASGGLADTTENAVKVIPEFKDNYCFVHITDPHIPEHFGPRNTETLEKIIDEINIINPEFVLLTGDGINRGQCEDQHEVLQRVLTKFEVPVYFVPGNHELYCWCGDERERQYFWKYWGWSYLDPASPYNMGDYTQNYYFDYGATRYLGLETYTIHIYDPDPRNCRQDIYGNDSLLSEQIDWLEDNLSDSYYNILFYHYDFGIGPPIQTPISTAGGLSILPALNSHDNIIACLYGHEHDHSTTYAGLTPTLMVLTEEACDDTPGDPDDGGAYRLLRVVEGDGGGEVTDYPLLTMGGLSLAFPQNPNDGTHDSVRGVIANANDYQFENGLIKFRVVDDGRSHVVDRGEIIQIVDCGSFLTYYVQVTIPASGGISVCVSPDSSSTRLVLESGDYDGDGISDIAIFRPSTGLWAMRELTRVYFGTPDDEPVPGDYNGDSTTDIAIFRESSGLWAIRNLTLSYFGSSSDLAVPGDFDGDGCCDIGIFRPDSGLWAIWNVTRTYFGSSGDAPVPGDYNGAGTKDIGIFRKTSGLWALRDISRIYFGASGDAPVPGDYDGDGSWEVGIFRRTSGLWVIKGISRVYFGSSQDQPAPADYDGNGEDDVGVFRSSSGLWAVGGISRAYYGRSDDIPVTR